MDVFFADQLGLDPDGALERSAGLLDLVRGAAVLFDQQPVVVLVRELGVDRQPERRLSMSGQPHGELDDLA